MTTTTRVADNPLDRARSRAGISLLHLSNVTGIAYTTLRRKMEHPEDLTIKEWVRIRDEIGFSGDVTTIVKGSRKAA